MNLDDGSLAKLMSLAKQVTAHSYSPYSHFRVGAALMTAEGEFFTGYNVENASFGLTLCAERSALATAIAAGAAPGSIKALLIYTPGDELHAPCGACRQVMHELMSADSMVVSSCDGSNILRWSKSDYLPEPFTPEALLSREEPTDG